MELNQGVLLLNTTYEPLTIISAKRAFKLLFSKKAHPIEYTNFFAYTVRSKIKIPSVIQIAYFIKKPYTKPKFSKKAVFIRDNYQCQYCGTFTTKPTIDHVLPRSKGGKTTWQNVVTACPSCNNKKSNKTLKEANLKLIREPKEPNYIVYTTFTHGVKRMETWKKYFEPATRPNSPVPVLLS